MQREIGIARSAIADNRRCLADILKKRCVLPSDVVKDKKADECPAYRLDGAPHPCR